ELIFLNQIKYNFMTVNIAIFKIGGKILENRDYLNSTISQLTSIYEKFLISKIILIAGGGSYANLIRKVDRKFKLGDNLSHWMAIYTMDINGRKIGKYFPRISKTRQFEDIKKAQRIFTVFLPYRFLKESDELPHSWAVTSDSITLYLAHKLGISQCFLIKDVDGIISINNEVLIELTTEEFTKLKSNAKLASLNLDDEKKESKPIDPYLLKIIDKYKIPCIILNGTSSSLRILKYFRLTDDQKKIYTKIKFS
ncbi:MAG: hypothetical protein ACFFFY_02145, partial [Promethearchaeota archaeon]